MEIVKNILDALFFGFPLFGGAVFFCWKVYRMEKVRSDEYVHTLETIAKTCGMFQIWLCQNIKEEKV